MLDLEDSKNVKDRKVVFVNYQIGVANLVALIFLFKNDYKITQLRLKARPINRISVIKPITIIKPKTPKIIPKAV